MSPQALESTAGSAGGSIRGRMGVTGSGDDPYKWPARCLLVMMGLTLPVVIGLCGLQPPPALSMWDSAGERLGVSPADLKLGAATFKRSCAVCHGRQGRGVARLGKPLRNSAYVREHTDDELIALIARGRPSTDSENTTGVAMPARAGDASLGNERLTNVVRYLRMMQEPGVPPVSVEAWVVASASGDGGGMGGPGHDVFVSSCSACHGPGGEGLEGLGKPLADSPFVGSKTDEELLKFVKSGRPIWDAENTTGIDMPPKGGNPALSDEDLLTIIGYLRTLHPEGGGA